MRSRVTPAALTAFLSLCYPETWTTYHDVNELSLCDDTMLFTFDILSTTPNPRIKACRTATKGPHMQAGAFYGLIKNDVTNSPSPELVTEMLTPDSIIVSQDGSCGASLLDSTIKTYQRWSGHGNSTSEVVNNASSELSSYFRHSAGCGIFLMFALSSEHTVIGAFAGGDLFKASVASFVEAQVDTILEHLPAQYASISCTTSENNNTMAGIDTRLGLFADFTGDLASVQKSLGIYMQDSKAYTGILNVEEGSASITSEVTVLGSSFRSNDTVRDLERRAACRDIQVIAGDGCGSLATRCGISGANFEKYKSKTPNICSTLQVKQWVCCSSGDLPDHTPQPGSDGVCNTYTLKMGDGC